MVEKCYSLDTEMGYCFEMDEPSEDTCHSPNCWGTEDTCCHSVKNPNGKNDDQNGLKDSKVTNNSSGLSPGASIAIGIVSIFAVVGLIALIIGGSGSKRRRTRGNRRSR